MSVYIQPTGAQARGDSDKANSIKSLEMFFNTMNEGRFLSPVIMIVVMILSCLNLKNQIPSIQKRSQIWRRVDKTDLLLGSKATWMFFVLFKT